MAQLDICCYGCGVALSLNVDELPDIPASPCSYCGATVRFLTYSVDRKALRDIAREVYVGDSVTYDALMDDVNLAQDGVDVDEHTTHGPGVDADAEDDLDDHGYGIEYDMERATAFVDGVPIRFAVRFNYAHYLGRATNETPEPPAMAAGDDRMFRYFRRVGKRYAEIVEADLKAVAPSFRPVTHPREPGETGGPGVGFDVVPLILVVAGALSAYPGLKELLKDARRLLAHLEEQTGEPAEIADAGIAYLFAADALEAHLRPSGGPIEITLLSTSPLIKTVDVPETYGYLVNLLVDSAMYVVAVGLGGRVASIAKTDVPLLEPPEFAGVV